MTKAECEEILRKNRWELSATNVWEPRARVAAMSVTLGSRYVLFGFREWPRLRYSTLLPELFRELIGAKK
ncbi:hypothetical protein M0R72_10715 [Candidatus Pacearchaeota archaeon]|jgi:hypothetical protein|nr:hypothetical protein [Candidatus Pacearchaeota archaeon]